MYVCIWLYVLVTFLLKGSWAIVTKSLKCDYSGHTAYEVALLHKEKFKKKKSLKCNGYLYLNVYSRIIHNSQKLETTLVSIKKCIENHNVVSTYK